MSKFQFFLILSIIVHLIFWMSLNFVIQPDHARKEAIEVTFLAPKKNNQTVEDDQLNKQIVDQSDQALNKETPEKDYFLSKNNQTVKKQMISRKKGDFRNTGKLVGDNSMDKKEMPLSTPANNQKFNPLTELSKRFKEQNLHTMSGDTASSSAAVSQTPDYLKDKEYGVDTILSTKEFKYYTYFNRIRRQLSQHWEPKVREKLTKMFRQGRTIASEQDRITKLLIILNNEGILVKVQMVSDSGVRDLDDAAIEAFKAASPFPNPPKGIVDPDGTVKIRWDFVLES